MPPKDKTKQTNGQEKLGEIADFSLSHIIQSPAWGFDRQNHSGKEARMRKEMCIQFKMQDLQVQHAGI